MTELLALPLAPVEGGAEPEEQRPARGAAAREEGGLPQHPRQPLRQPWARLDPRLQFRRRRCGGQRGEGGRGTATPGPPLTPSPALPPPPDSRSCTDTGALATPTPALVAAATWVR